jgi:pheromone shutdown protein TraB
MKKGFILLIVMFCSFSSYSHKLPKTEIIIIGTVHKATEAYSEDTLFHILERIHPDVILREHPVSWSVDSFLEEAKKFEYPGLETVALLKYIEKAPSVLLRNYDIAGRNKFYKEIDYFEKQKKLFGDLKELDDSNKLDGLEEVLLERFYIFFRIIHAIAEENIRVINSTSTDSVLSLEEEYLMDDILKVTEIVPELNKFSNYVTVSKNFWEKRNRKMAEHIIEYSKEFQGKRMVVITGFEHRYPLRKQLYESEETNFVLKEYWECMSDK